MEKDAMFEVLRDYNARLDAKLAEWFRIGFEKEPTEKSAMERVSKSMQDEFPALSQELRKVSKQLKIEVGTLESVDVHVVRKTLFSDVQFDFENPGKTMLKFYNDSFELVGSEGREDFEGVFEDARPLEEQGVLIGFDAIDPDSRNELLVVNSISVEGAKVTQITEFIAYGKYNTQITGDHEH